MRTHVLPQRTLAYLVDSFFVFLLWTPIFSFVNRAGVRVAEDAVGENGLPSDDPTIWVASWLSVLLLSWALWPLVSVPYYALQEGFLGGRTLGKRLAGVRVVKAEGGGPIGLGRAVVRSLMRLVDGLPFLYLLGWFVAVCSEEGRRLGDFVAGTAVVDVREPRTRVSPPFGPAYGDDALEAKYAAGAEGERVVQEALAPLVGMGCFVFSCLPHRAFGDVDNLVVGPTGIWVVETKAHRGQVSVDGHTGALLRDGEPFEKDFYEQVQKQADHVWREVSDRRGDQPVRWTICFTRARIVPGRDGGWPTGVSVPEELPGLLSSGPILYQAGEVSRIARDVERTYGVAPWATPEGTFSREG